MPRFLTDGHRPSSDRFPVNLPEFYREEFQKHRRCLERQREYYSEGAIQGAEYALERAMAEIDTWCRRGTADRLVGLLLRQFDALTGLSAWSDPKKVN